MLLNIQHASNNLLANISILAFLLLELRTVNVLDFTPRACSPIKLEPFLRGMFCLLISQGGGGNHSQADEKRLPPDREGRDSCHQAVYTQGRCGAHQSEQAPAAARSEY